MKKIITILTAIATCASMSARMMVYSANDVEFYLKIVSASAGTISADGTIITFASPAEAKGAKLVVQEFIKADHSNPFIQQVGSTFSVNDKSISLDNGVSYSDPIGQEKEYTLNGNTVTTDCFVSCFAYANKRKRFASGTGDATWGHSKDYTWAYDGVDHVDQMTIIWASSFDDPNYDNSTETAHFQGYASDAFPFTQFEATIGDVTDGTYTIDIIDSWEHAELGTQNGTFINVDGKNKILVTNHPGIKIVVGDSGSSTDDPGNGGGTDTTQFPIYQGDEGTEAKPYLIKTIDDLNKLSADVNSGTNYSGKYFRLENDLDYSGVTVDGGSNFTPIGWATDFYGNFDGQGHTISGVMIESTAGSQGIFGTIGTAATVKNLVIANSNITGGNNTGAVVGMANGNIENCHVLGDVIIAGTGYNHGGIAGYGNVIACTSAAIISATDTPAGGIVGSGDANNCLYYGTILPTDASTIGTLSYGYVTNYQTYDATTTSHEYVRVYDADPGIMGTATKTYADTGYKVYGKGVSYGGKFYTAVVAMTEDGITNLTAYAGKKIDVAFGRSFDALGTSTGVHAATICLPFSFAKPDASVGTFYTFDGVTGSGDDYTVTMTEVSGTEITAGTPYMFVPAGSGATVFENAAFTVPSEGFTAAGKTEVDSWAFTGTYTKQTWASGQTRLYGFAGKNFQTGGTDLNDIGAFRRFDYGTTAAFRCYLMAPGTAGARTRGSGAALPESMRVVLKGADGSITGIGTIDTMTGEATLDGNGPWYTLGGQYLQGKPSRPGIYIHNGKKVVIK